jgi:N-hydroxyarylamine O-acetyltransferase
VEPTAERDDIARAAIRHVLDGTTLTSTRVDGTSETARIDPAEVPRTLEAVFGIVLDAADTARLVSVLGRP